MAKKTDLKFEDETAFLTANPTLSVTKPTPNYAAIRAILRSGAELPGVKLVEVSEAAEESPTINATESNVADTPAGGTATGVSDAESKSKDDSHGKNKLFAKK